MNNSSTSNSEFKRFAAKVTLRLILLLALCMLVFLIPLPRSYYFSLLKYSDYSKMHWVENKLNSVESLDSTIVFVGSSICLNGINDSLLNELDTSTTQYLNCGITHTCYAVIDAILEEMIEQNKLRPKKVILCFKGDAMARNIHNMYPAQARTSHILKSAAEFNTLFFPCFLKRVSWNVNSLTHTTKYTVNVPEKEFTSKNGFKPLNTISTDKVEKAYINLRAGSESNFNAIQNQNEGKELPLKSKVSLAITDVMQNIIYQRAMFENGAKRLDDLGIPYDILVYPNLVSARMAKQGIMANYVKRTFKGIDFDKHRVITVTDTSFANAKYYNDMNHLNPKGADLLTNFVYRELTAAE
jgi:hypothetical protein